ncbi:GNAT family N-acetyltransferase [Microvirga puerhi]|uniref:GNAT family N-acetyltransferase n=1 Tax=Microvirga puerhi TaxID=2876078 RepID=A0ABS7VI05_9HYPH|nr:GNAT family N-acetyltransferase [Microvirga puerhi]MBZ6074697.1 GNAT family N-acetyltransferase [Microvirga puerhi]
MPLKRQLTSLSSGAPGLVPVLETERLRLRGHRAEDFPACLALWTDPEVTRFIGGRPSTQEEVWSRLLRYVGHWDLLGYGYWVIEDKETGAFLGETGFADFRRTIEPPIDGQPEIGWVLAPSAQGRGLATEAVQAVLKWGDAHFGPVPTVCLIAPENTPSLRVAEKCDYRPFVRATYREGITLLMRRDPAKSETVQPAAEIGQRIP